jgi:hypothetical protein
VVRTYCLGVPRFLTAEWAAAAEQAVRPLALPGAGPVTLAHLVRGAPEGDVTWVVEVRDGRASVTLRPGLDAGGADVVLVEDYATACALARGEMTAEEAVAAGRLKLRSGAQALVTHAAALRSVGEALAALRADTTW